MLEANWRDRLVQAIEQSGGITNFSRNTGVARSTIHGWLNNVEPSLEKHQLIQELINGVATSHDSRKMEEIDYEAEKPESAVARCLAQQLKGVVPLMVFFMDHSSLVEREIFRRVLGSDQEDLLDCANGLFSEKALQQVQKERKEKIGR